MAATWKTKWGVRRVRRETPTIEEALIAAESLAADPAQRAEIAASLMGVPVEEVKIARGQTGREDARPGEPGRRPHPRGRRRVQAPAHEPANRRIQRQPLTRGRARLRAPGPSRRREARAIRPHKLARFAAEGRVVRYWLRAATSVEMTATAISVSVVISTKSTLRKASATTAEKAAAI